MDEFRYKAFISYSHQDERWAAWLQRALERYRVPKRLVGRTTDHGPVPDRLRPVFRDREDLSSASDLTSRIKQELAASETLIVICSPNAAKSRWVREEIRHFREAGRSDRILALVVGGDPADQVGEAGCFPTALVDDGDGRRREPLAADARRYADGKHLALLKIVAGILGIRLDELRRRDAQRRLRRRAVNSVVAASLALLIAWLFHSAQSSKETVRMQRAGTEELISFMLGDLDRLDPIVGLETISQHDGELEELTGQLGLTELDNEELLDRALGWRKIGLELEWEMDLDAAQAEFVKSRAALVELHRRERKSPTALFELGQAEYYVGLIHVNRGEINEAREHWSQYGALTRRLVNADPYNPKYVAELAYTLSNLGALEQKKAAPDYERALELLQAAVQYIQLALVLDPEKLDYRLALATSLEWTADAQMGICALGDALEVRQETLAVRRNILRNDPKAAQNTIEVAYALSGLAGVQQAIGLGESAIASYRESVDLLKSVSENEPENAYIAWQALYREIRLAGLLLESGQRDAAANIILAQGGRVGELAESRPDVDQFTAVESALFRLDHARVLLDGGDRAGGERRLREATGRLAELVVANPDFRDALLALVRVYFEYWQHFGETPGSAIDDLVRRFTVSAKSSNDCNDAALAARLAIVEGNRDLAGQYVDYALGKGYYRPEFINFCRRYGLCQSP